MKLLLMFSFYTNGAAILDTAPPKQGHLRCVDCIRFLSMLWVVSGHVMEMWLHNGMRHWEKSNPLQIVCMSWGPWEIRYCQTR